MQMEVTMQKKHVVTTWMSLMLWYKLALLHSKLLLESSIERGSRVHNNFPFLVNDIHRSSCYLSIDHYVHHSNRC